MTYHNRLIEISKNPIIKQIEDYINDITISQKYDTLDIIELDTLIIEYLSLCILSLTDTDHR